MKGMTAYLPKDHPMHGKLKHGDTVNLQATVKAPDADAADDMKEAHALEISDVEKSKPAPVAKGKKSPIEYLKEKQRERSK